MEITANALQEVSSGGNVVFTDTPISGNCSIIHRDGSGLVKIRGIATTQCRARFKVFFSGNIGLPSGGSVDEISLALSIDGEPIAATSMMSYPAAVLQYFNVSSETYVDVPAGCCSTVGVINTSGVSINVQNANLIVERVA